MTRTTLVAALASSLALSACASIMHGTSQDVGISSTPTSASVSIDNSDKGQTPFVAKLSRKDNHVIHIAADGYQPADLTLTHSTSGWVWGNLLFGGIIGLAVDADHRRAVQALSRAAERDAREAVGVGRANEGRILRRARAGRGEGVAQGRAAGARERGPARGQLARWLRRRRETGRLRSAVTSRQLLTCPTSHPHLRRQYERWKKDPALDRSARRTSQSPLSGDVRGARARCAGVRSQEGRRQ